MSGTVYLVLVDHSGQYALNAYLNRDAAHSFARDVEGVVMSLPVDVDYRVPAKESEPS